MNATNKACLIAPTIAEALRLARELATADDRILDDPPVTIAVSELADSSVNFVVRPWVRTSDYWGVFFSLTEAIKKRFDEAGISIPFPQQDVHIHKVPAD